MKLFYYLFIFLFFKLLLLLVINGDVILKDITPTSLNKYPYDSYTDSDYGQCNFENIIILLQSSTIPTNPSFLLKLTSISNGEYSKNDVLFNQSAYIYSISISKVIDPVTILTLTGEEGGVNSNQLQLVLNCHKLDPLDLQEDFKTPMDSNVFGSIGYFVKLKDVPCSPKLITSISTSSGIAERIGNSLIFYYTKSSYLSLNTDNSIKFNDKLTITQSNYYSNDIDDILYNIVSLPFYPTFNVMGDMVAPLITFSTNSSYYIPAIIIAANYSTGVYNSRLVSTDGLIKNFHCFLDYRINEGEKIVYRLSSQKQNQFYERYAQAMVINGIEFIPIPTTGSINQTSNRVAVKFQTGNIQYKYSTVYLRYVSNAIMTTFPFGYTNGTNNYGYSFDVTLSLPSFMKENAIVSVQCDLGNELYSIEKNSGFSSNIVSPTPTTSNYPIFGDYEFIYLFDFIYILRMEITSEIAIYKIQINDKIFNNNALSKKDLNLSGGIYEFELNLFSASQISIKVNDNLNYGVASNGFYSMNLLKPFLIPTNIDPEFNFLNIKNCSILYKTIDVTNKTVGNILYFNYENIDINTPIGLLINSPSFSINNGLSLAKEDLYDKLYFAKYNNSIKAFQVEFWVKANSQPGNIPFALFFNSKTWVPNSVMGENAQFTVISNNADLQGPIFSNIERYPSNNLTVNSTFSDSFKIGWRFEIQDKINGFKSGKIKVMGSVDGSIYNFEFNSVGRGAGAGGGGSINYLYNTEIEINLIKKCVSQDYIITEVALLDNQDNNSTFLYYNYKKSIIQASLYNPFINFFNDTSINRITVNCPLGSFDNTPPVITYLGSSGSANVRGLINRDVSFSVSVKDEQSGLKPDTAPIIYLSSIGFQTISCQTYLYSVDSSDQSTFKCNRTIPLGFGYPYNMILSIYGLVNNGGYYGGYSNDGLKGLGLTATTIIAFFDNIQPVITGSSKVSVEGGEFWIIGKDLSNVMGVFPKVGNSLTIVNRVGEVAILLRVGKVTGDFEIFVDSFSGYPHLIKTYKPVEFINQTLTPTPSSTPTPTPVITNAPQKCIGNPECGGKDNGYCTELGCQCISPWIGTDCLSKVLIVPTPTTNITNPSTEIPIIKDNGGETSNYLFKSLISIVSIRELSFDYQLVKNHTFDKWIFTPINENSSKYFTSIPITPLSSIGGGGGGDVDETTITYTNVTVLLEWFKDEKNITFANENLIMQPSSMKYTIEISKHKFESNLNHLQLVMMASLESSKTNNICSKSEFGETSNGDNSNYVKIQIDTSALYGRFIKRAILDSNKIISISNIPLDSSFNSVNTKNSAHSYQSYIGITIPKFENSIIIDPDFSVLVGSKPTSSSDNNSICNISKSGLTTSQLAGIIVGSSVAFIAIVIIIAFIFIRSRRHTLFLLKIKDIKMFKSK